MVGESDAGPVIGRGWGVPGYIPQCDDMIRIFGHGTSAQGLFREQGRAVLNGHLERERKMEKGREDTKNTEARALSSDLLRRAEVHDEVLEGVRLYFVLGVC